MKPGSLLLATVATSALLAACGGEERDEPRATSSASPVRELPDPIDAARPMLNGSGSYRAVTTLSDGGRPLITETRYDVGAKLVAMDRRAPDLEGEMLRTQSIFVQGDYYARSRLAEGPVSRCWLGTRLGKNSIHLVSGLQILEDVRSAGEESDDSSAVAVQVVADDAINLVAPQVLSDHEYLDPALMPAEAVVRDGRVATLTYELADAVEALEETGLEVRDLVVRAFGNDSPGQVVVTYAPPAEDLDLDRPDERYVGWVDDDRPAAAPECAGLV